MVLIAPARRHLADERKSITHKFVLEGPSGNHKGYVIVGMFDDGTPGELFIRVNKKGSTTQGFADSWAILFSTALQYGVPLEALVAKFKDVRFEPSGRTYNEKVPEAASIVDYVCRWLETQFLNTGKKAT